MQGPTFIFWANLTPSSLQRELDGAAAGVARLDQRVEALGTRLGGTAAAVGTPKTAIDGCFITEAVGGSLPLCTLAHAGGGAWRQAGGRGGAGREGRRRARRGGLAARGAARRGLGRIVASETEIPSLKVPDVLVYLV